ncbi:MAG: MBL fold metallo-hydrolase [Pseudomonadota bacterium]
MSTEQESFTQRPVAKRWRSVVPHQDDVVCLQEVHVDPYVVGDAWWVKGTEMDLIIDTGSGIVPLAPLVELLTDRPVLAVALCPFYDHAGSWAEFDNRACHLLDAPALLDPSEEISLVSDYLTDTSLCALPYKAYSTSTYTMTGAAPTRLLEDGDSICIGNRRLDVLHVPGRSPGSLALWEAETGSLFTSDMLYDGEHGLAWPPAHPEDYRRGLQRFQELPVTQVFPGHYGAFDGSRMHELIDEQLADLCALASS